MRIIVVDCGTGLWTRRYGPRLLLAVDGALNEQKGDADAAGWLPPYDYVGTVLVTVGQEVGR